MEDLRLEIRGQIARYLSGAIDARVLYDWLVPATWEIERRASVDVADFARTVHLLLEEFASEGWSESELQSRLRGLIGLVGAPRRFEISSGSTSNTSKKAIPFTLTRSSLTGRLMPVGTQLERASA